MKRQRKRKTCSECKEAVENLREGICLPCLAELEAEEAKFLASRKMQPKRHCRMCKEELPADRYFKHKECDYAHHNANSGGRFESIWTGDEYGVRFAGGK